MYYFLIEISFFDFNYLIYRYMLSKKVKIGLDFKQDIILNTLSNEHRMLYNFLLNYLKHNILNYKALNNEYKLFRHNNGLTINSKSAQNTCINLINNIKSYLTLKNKDKTARFPYHFKSYKYFTSFMLDYNNGCGGFKIKDNQLIVNLLSYRENTKKLVIDLPYFVKDITNENVKTVTFKKEENDYYVIFVFQEEKSLNQLNKDNYLSIDLGYSTLITGCSKDKNIKIQNYKQKKLFKDIADLQSHKDLKKKGSKKYRKLYSTFKRKKVKLANKQRDFQHKASKKVIDFCVENNIGSLIVGDLKVKKVINKENIKINGLSKSTNAISRFKTFLAYKAEKANIDFKLINEYNTSKVNCLTGEVEFDSSLNNRLFNFNELKIDRDLNSSINILKRSGVCLTHVQMLTLLQNNVSELKL